MDPQEHRSVWWRSIKCDGVGRIRRGGKDIVHLRHAVRRALLSQGVYRKRPRRAHDGKRTSNPHNAVGFGSTRSCTKAGPQAPGDTSVEVVRNPVESAARWIAGPLRRKKGDRCVGPGWLQPGGRWACSAFASVRPGRAGDLGRQTAHSRIEPRRDGVLSHGVSGQVCSFIK